MTEIYVDADGCPVKDEVYRVAERYGLTVHVVSGRPIRVPRDPRVRAVVAGDGFDAADDWIAKHAGRGDVVVTADLPLAARCIEAGARLLGPQGRELDEESIGAALASRELLAGLREMGVETGGPAPLTRKDRSRFLGELDRIVQALRRGR